MMFCEERVVIERATNNEVFTSHLDDVAGHPVNLR